MHKSTISVAALVPCLLWYSAPPAYADHRHVDTETLHGWCKPYDVGVAGIGRLCAGYINAIVDILDRDVPIHGYRACIPEDVKLSDLHVVVVKKLRDRPEVADKYGYDWVARALAENYPCKN